MFARVSWKWLLLLTSMACTSSFRSLPAFMSSRFTTTATKSTGVYTMHEKTHSSHGRFMTSLSAALSDTTGSSWRGASAISLNNTADLPTVMNREDITRILPHRAPFLFVDRVVEFEAGKRAVGLKNVATDEAYFAGHFPGRPVLPGVIAVEAMAQLGGMICLQPPVTEHCSCKVFLLAEMKGVKWTKPVLPGDVLVMEVTLQAFLQRCGLAVLTGKAYVDGKLAVSIEEFTLVLAKD